MRIDTVMTTNVATCTPVDSSDRAAKLMQERDCGAIPVVDADDQVVAMVTDRDICMAALTLTKLLSQILVKHCMTEQITCIRADATVEEAARLMRQDRVRRLPVVGATGKLVAMLSIEDLAVAAAHPTPVVDVGEHLVAQTLAAVCEPAVTRAAE